MRLSDVYSPGTKLPEVNPDFHGMSPQQWTSLDVARQMDAYQESITPRQKAAAPIHKQKIITAAGYYQKGEES
jgi:hypothetical protein